MDVNKILIDAQYHDTLGGIYQVRTLNGDFFISKSFDVFLSSGDISVKRGKNNYYDTLYIEQDMSYIKENALFTIGKGKKELILVSNAECGFCLKMHKEFDNLEGFYDKYKFYVVLLRFNGENSKKIYSTILSSSTPDMAKERYYNVLNNKFKKTYSTMSPERLDDKKIESFSATFKDVQKKLGTKGTPSFYKFNGEPINPGRLIHNYKESSNDKNKR